MALKKNVAPPKPRKHKGSKYRKTQRAKILAAKTPEEKEIVRQKIKLTQAKRNATRAKKNIKNIVESSDLTLQDVVPQSDIDSDPIFQEEIEKEIIFQPTEKQAIFLAASEDEVFYGGARGGGKTYSLIADPLRYCDNPNMSGLLVRRTMPELRDILHHMMILYPKAYPGAKFNKQENTWRFPSGARIELGYAETEQDALRYQGRAYTWIGIDELPQYESPAVYNMLQSSCRSTDPTIPAQMRATGNPGNIGSWWVKEMFINAAPPNETFEIKVSYDSPQGPRERVVRRRYIPATVWDNPYLTYDDAYVSMLATLPEVKRKQFLEGNWDVFEGAAFPEFDRAIHVVEPFDVPNNWYKFRMADWGYATPFCVLWGAVDWDGILWIYREYYDKGVLASDFAKNVLEIEEGERIQYGVIDGSVSSRRGEIGPSVYESMVAAGCRWRFADRHQDSRRTGKLEIHKYLAVNEFLNPVGPSLRVFNNCPKLIHQLATLPVDKLDDEKVEKKNVEDHAYDALKYGIMSRPVNPMHIVDVNAFRERNQPKTADEKFGY